MLLNIIGKDLMGRDTIKYLPKSSIAFLESSTKLVSCTQLTYSLIWMDEMTDFF